MVSDLENKNITAKSLSVAEMKLTENSLVRAIYRPSDMERLSRMSKGTDDVTSASVVLVSNNNDFMSFSVVSGQDLIGMDSLDVNDIARLSMDGDSRLMIYGNTDAATSLKAFQKLVRDFPEIEPAAIMSGIRNVDISEVISQENTLAPGELAKDLEPRPSFKLN